MSLKVPNSPQKQRHPLCAVLGHKKHKSEFYPPKNLISDYLRLQIGNTDQACHQAKQKGVIAIMTPLTYELTSVTLVFKGLCNSIARFSIAPVLTEHRINNGFRFQL